MRFQHQKIQRKKYGLWEKEGGVVWALTSLTVRERKVKAKKKKKIIEK
jgi:hypothetical protein